ncbi:MAG TPA: carbamate kinase [Candidatus Faecimonas gallistercoris]|nr:carbamate kinase [Candidatus Faecimonas gallistercoris]
MKKRIVIALGGNALGNSPEEQLRLVQGTAKAIVDLADDYDIVVTHGNGPQVGMINMAMEVAHDEVGTPVVGFAECGAMSQGYIGYHLQQSIQEELKARNIDKRCSTVLTQVVVDKDDSAFSNPTKPIGSFYTKEEADRMAQERGYIFKEDAGRGYRRVVASPVPKEIVEIDTIQLLLENNNIVIAGGGGGIPVARYDNKLQGVAAVIDKDKTSAQLAIDIKADIFLILTAVEKVCINYNTENEKKLDFLTPELAKQYIEDGEFKPGSMLPKIEACLKFVEYNNTATALITSLDKAKEALEGKTGTVIGR